MNDEPQIDIMDDTDYKFNLAEASGNNLVTICYGLAKAAGWHNDLVTGEPIKHNIPTRLILMISEIIEGFEGYRKDNRMDDHIPNRSNLSVELADCVIRIADFCGTENIDLGGAISDKLKYNQTREDHKPEARLAKGGKKL